eukprot:3024453-Amphidinium_carterae.1
MRSNSASNPTHAGTTCTIHTHLNEVLEGIAQANKITCHNDSNPSSTSSLAASTATFKNWKQMRTKPGQCIHWVV